MGIVTGYLQVDRDIYPNKYELLLHIDTLHIPTI